MSRILILLGVLSFAIANCKKGEVQQADKPTAINTSEKSRVDKRESKSDSTLKNVGLPKDIKTAADLLCKVIHTDKQLSQLAGGKSIVYQDVSGLEPVATSFEKLSKYFKTAPPCSTVNTKIPDEGLAFAEIGWYSGYHQKNDVSFVGEQAIVTFNFDSTNDGLLLDKVQLWLPDKVVH